MRFENGKWRARTGYISTRVKREELLVYLIVLQFSFYRLFHMAQIINEVEPNERHSISRNRANTKRLNIQYTTNLNCVWYKLELNANMYLYIRRISTAIHRVYEIVHVLGQKMWEWISIAESKVKIEWK